MALASLSCSPLLAAAGVEELEIADQTRHFAQRNVHAGPSAKARQGFLELGNPRDCALQGACGEPQVTVYRFCLTSDCNRVMVHRVVILFMAMTGPQPSARATADPRTVRLALELLERTAGRRRRCRRCRSVIAENARKRGQTWSVCTPCAQAIKDDARQLEIAPALLRRCLVCRTDIAHLRASARICADACRNVLSWILRCRRRPVL